MGRNDTRKQYMEGRSKLALYSRKGTRLRGKWETGIKKTNRKIFGLRKWQPKGTQEGKPSNDSSIHHQLIAHNTSNIASIQLMINHEL